MLGRTNAVTNEVLETITFVHCVCVCVCVCMYDCSLSLSLYIYIYINIHIIIKLDGHWYEVGKSVLYKFLMF